MDFLKAWAEKYNLSPEWAERGFWRWRKFNEKGQIHLASEMGISEEKIIWQKDHELQFHLTQGISPCQDGSFSIEGRVQGYLDTTAIMNQLGIIGSVNYSETLGVINLRSADLSLNLFSDGTLIIRGGKEKIEENLEVILSLIKRANECIGCGICISQCLKKALTLKDERIWVNHQLCDHCRACLEKCSIIKYT
jgi:phosphoadenosine phosphosulfate reductase